MDNQYCIYVLQGNGIAHLPEQKGFRRYIPADLCGRIMNISLFKGTKTEQSIVMVEQPVSRRVLLCNYHLSDILLLPLLQTSSGLKHALFSDFFFGGKQLSFSAFFLFLKLTVSVVTCLRETIPAVYQGFFFSPFEFEG